MYTWHLDFIAGLIYRSGSDSRCVYASTKICTAKFGAFLIILFLKIEGEAHIILENCNKN